MPTRLPRRVRRSVAVATAFSAAALTACGGDGGTAPPARTPTLGMTLASAAMSAAQGETKTSTVTLTRGGGFAGAVDLAATGAPAGVNVTFTPAGAGVSASTMSVAVLASAAPGTYPLVVRGVGTGVSPATAPLTLTVTQAVTPTIGLAASVASVQVPAGASREGALTVSRGAGYAGAVELTAAVVGDAPGLSASVAPASIAAGTGNAAAAVTVNAAAGATRGAATVRLTATGTGVAPATVDLPVTVLVPAVGVTAPAATSIAQGAAGTSTVAFSRTDFTGEVTISVVNPPAGVTATAVTVPEGQSSGVLNLNVAAGAAVGAAPLTVRVAGPGGSPSATTTLPLTVTAAPLPASVALAVAPSPVAITAGGAAANATVTLTRTNFAGGVALTASGAPAGLTVTVPNGPVTANTATLAVQAGAGVAAGDYPITVTGAAQGLTNATASFVARVAGGNNGGGGSTVRITFCEDDAPVWVAAKNGDGAWTRLTAVAPRQYDVTVGQRAGLASVSAEQGGYDMTVMYLSAAELTGFAQNGCVPAPSGGKTVNGSVAGLGADARATVSLGQGFGVAMADGPFTIMNVNDGAHALIATRSDEDDVVDRMILRRGVNAPAGSTLPLLDFGGAEAFAPTSATVTVQNLGADQASVISFLYAGTFGTGMLSNAQGTGALRVVGVPAAQLQAGEFNTVFVSAGAANGSGPQRYSMSFLRGLSNATVSMGAVLSAPVVSTPATAPYARPQLQLAAQADYNAFANANFSQGAFGSAAYRSVSVSQTAGYAGSAPATWNLSVPDFSGVAGFDAAWGLHGANYKWDAAAYGGSLVRVLGGAPSEGTAFRFATRSGAVGAPADLRASAVRGAPTAARAQAAAARLARLSVVGRR